MTKKFLLILLLFSLFSLTTNPRAYAWGLGHHKMTAAAYAVLPEAQKSILEPYAEKLIYSYSMYPDRRHSPEAAPYMVFIDGRHFHYMPIGTPEKVRKFIIRGFIEYTEKTLESFRAGKVEDGAQFLGSFFHVLQDSAQPGGHALEGPHGMTWEQLAGVIAPPDGAHPLFSPNTAIQLLIDHDARPEFTVDIAGYMPRLLGIEKDEIAFHLYASYLESARVARAVQAPAAVRLHAGDRLGAIEILQQAAEASARVCADLAYTLLKVSSGTVAPADMEALKRVDFTKVEPVSVPQITRFPYRFTPLILNASLGRYRRVEPLELWLEDDGNKIRQVFERGFSTGMVTIEYDIPAGIFSHLDVITGIHATLGADDWGGLRLEREAPAAFEMSISLNQEVLWESGILTENTPAERVSVPVLEGGRLAFTSTNKSKSSVNHGNQPVWANPELIRGSPEN